MTKNCRMRDSAVMMSSVIPSEKYSCSGSPLRFSKGNTAIEGLSNRSLRPNKGCEVMVVASVRGSVSLESLTPVMVSVWPAVVVVLRDACFFRSLRYRARSISPLPPNINTKAPTMIPKITPSVSNIRRSYDCNGERATFQSCWLAVL